MIRGIVGALGLLSLTTTSAVAQTCSTSNIECNTKIIVNPIFGPQQTGASANKLITNVVTDAGQLGSSKIIVNVVAIPGSGVAGVVPMSPQTGFR